MIKVSTFCSGIGAAEQAFKNLDVAHEVVFACEIDKYARMSYEANHSAETMYEDMTQHDYVDSKYYSDINISGIPCFKPGTLITTSNGLIPIEEIKKGDFVLTHKNRFCEVITPMNKISKSILNIKIQGSTQIEATEEHPFYAREMSRKWNNDRRCDERVFSEAYWVKAKDLIVGKHFVGFGMNTESANTQNLNNEECWFLGRYMADGYLTSRGKKTSVGKVNVYKITLCVGYAKVDSFPIFKTIKTTPIKERTAVKYHTYNKRLHGLCFQIGRGSENKQIPTFIMNLPINMLTIFINGYLSGDGSVRDGKYSLTTVSKKLAYSISQAIYKCYNTPTSITFTKRPPTTIIEGRTVNQKDTYRVQFCKEKRKQNNGIFIDGNIWQPVKSIIENTEYNDFVYNFEVADDNSYVAESCIVHNCQAFSLAGLRKGENDSRGLLFYDFYRYVKNQQPKIFIIENVKGLLSADKGVIFQNWIELLGRSVNGHEKMFLHEDSLEYNLHHTVLNSKNFGVPQNRERVFLVGIRKDLPNDFRFPLGWKLDNRLRDVLETEVDEKYYLSDKMQSYLINRKDNFNGGKINYKSENDVASCINASSKSIDISDNIIVEKVGFINQDTQASQVYGTNGISPTLSAGTHGYAQGYIKVPEATKQGFAIAGPGDSINISNPNSLTRRGRVGKGIANTLETSCNQVVVEPFYVAMRGRNPENKNDRTAGANLKQTLEINSQGTTNCLSTVQKDNLIVEPQVNKIGQLDGYESDGRIYDSNGISPTIDTYCNKRPLFKESLPQLNQVAQIDGFESEGRVYDANGIARTIKDGGGGGSKTGWYKVDEDWVVGGLQKHQTPRTDGICPALTSAMGMGGGQTPIVKVYDEEKITLIEHRGHKDKSPKIINTEIAPTLRAESHGHETKLLSGSRIRRLTPLEVFRLQAFSDEFFHKAKAVNSDTQLYRQAGNSITVTVLESIIKNLLHLLQ